MCALLADTLTTGFGVIQHDGQVRIGESVVIIGCGGIGLGIVLGAKLAGAYPIIVAYENQLLEFAAEHREMIVPVRQKLRVLYPRPTVWASHPLIALDASGNNGLVKAAMP